MRKSFAPLFLASLIGLSGTLNAHCQMPCGIYHDDMVFDQIDQYVETMFKGMSVLTESKFSTIKDRNEFVRWVVLKESASDEVSNVLLKYFLQQKIKPGEDDTADKLKSIHKMLFQIVAIKQNVDTKMVMDFGDEWEHFKDFFHPEGYECQVELLKCTKEQKELTNKIKGLEKDKKKDQDHTHDHDSNHDHDHEHGDDHDHPHK